MGRREYPGHQHTKLPEPVAEILRRSPVLGCLHPETVRELEKRGRCREFGGRQLIGGDTDTELVCVVLRGEVRRCLLSLSGGQLDLSPRVVGDCFLARPPDLGWPAATIIQAGPEGAMLWEVSRELLLHRLTLSPHCADNAIKLLLRGLMEQRDELAALAFCDVPTRLARKLLQLTAASPNGEVLATHEELANMTACARQQVTEWLGVFRNEGLIYSMSGCSSGYYNPCGGNGCQPYISCLTPGAWSFLCNNCNPNIGVIYVTATPLTSDPATCFGC